MKIDESARGNTSNEKGLCIYNCGNIKEKDMPKNCNGLETSGLLSGNIPSEVDHQRLGLTWVFIIWLHTHIPLPFFALQTSIWPLSIIPCSNYSSIEHVSTSCDASRCIKQESPLSPSWRIIPASHSASKMNLLEVNTSPIYFSLWLPLFHCINHWASMIGEWISLHIQTVLLKRQPSPIKQAFEPCAWRARTAL